MSSHIPPSHPYQREVDRAARLASTAADLPAGEQARTAALASIALSLSTITQMLADAGLADLVAAVDSIAQDICFTAGTDTLGRTA